MSPRTLKQNLEIRKQKEELILSAALKLFSENGFLGTSMQNISKEAGVSKGNIYNYFESKDDLLEGVLIQGMNEFSSLLGSYSDGLKTEEDFEKAIRGNIQILKLNNKYWKLYFSILTQPQSQLLFQKIFAPFLAEYLKVFEYYFKRKGNENPHVTSMLLGSTLDGISLGYLMMGDLYPLDNVLNELIEKFK
jgi:AcrR family transcriptional regulator